MHSVSIGFDCLRTLPAGAPYFRTIIGNLPSVSCVGRVSLAGICHIKPFIQTCTSHIDLLSRKKKSPDKALQRYLSNSSVAFGERIVEVS
jgi:hypothetical protein